MHIESKRNIAKYIFAFGSVQGLNIAIGIVRTKLVALLLGPNGMGITALYNSAVNMMQNAVNLGLDKSGVPGVSQAFESGDGAQLRDALKVLRTWYMTTALLGIVVCIMFSWLLSLFAFGDFSRTLHFMTLSPVASLLIIAGGETAILKATHRLKRVAALSLWNVLLALVISIPLFYVWGAHAIIPSIILCATMQALVTIAYSYSAYRPEMSFNMATMRAGVRLVRTGMLFVVASCMTSGAEFLIRAFFNTHGSDTIVGLYNIGYMISVTYAGIVFAAVDSEYYPRLSRIATDNPDKLNATVRRQVLMLLMFIVPMVAVLELLLPWIVPLLFSSKFVDAIPMTQVALLSVVFRAVYLPIGYVPLSRNDGRTFVVMESCSAVALLVMVTAGFVWDGLIGAAVGLVLSHAFDMVNYMIINYRRYGLRLI